MDLSGKEDNFMAAMKKIFLLVVGIFLCVGPLAAEPSAAGIFGTVQRQDGSAILGVAVVATHPGRIGMTAAVSDVQGEFNLFGLTPGIYVLTFTLEGYHTLIRKNVPLGLQKTVHLKIVMRPARIAGHGTEPGTLERQDSPWGMTLSKEVFQTLPRGRASDSLATIVPAFSDESLLLDGTSVDGASGLENKYFIDGVNVTDILDGSPGQRVAFDFVDEVQCKASGAPAEFSSALGGVIRVVTRSGGNEFHGEVVGYYSGAPLRAGFPDILALDPTDDSRAFYQPYEYFHGDNDNHRFEGGLSLGGAILKDKLWFFGSFMPVFYRNNRTLEYYGSYAQQWRRTENELNFLLKLDARPLRNLRLSASMLNLFHRYQGDLPSFPSVPDPYISYDEYGFSYPNLSGSFNADLTIGNNFMFNARVGYFRTNQNNPLVRSGDTPYYYFRTEAPGGYYKTSPLVFPEIPPQYWRPPDGGYAGRSRPIIPTMERNVVERLNLGLDLNGFINLGGKHSWKVGLAWARRGQDKRNTPDAPIISLAWDRNFIAYGKNYGRGKYGYYAVRGNDVTGPYGDFYKAYGNMLAIYLQDDWIIANRLTLNFGIRAESENIPFYTDDPAYANLDAVCFGLGDKLAPRLGFVWDILGDSSLKAFGSYGLFYDDMKLAMVAGVYGGSKWKSAYYTLDTYEWDKIGVNGYYPGQLILPAPGTIDFRAPAFDATAPDLKPMTQQEIALGLEKKLGQDLVLSMRIVHKRLLRAIEDIGVETSEGKKFYIANPGGDFIKAKYAEARAAGLIPANAPDCPKAKRDYYGISIALDKRFSANWLGGVSYTWSRLLGNYSGLASADEINPSAPYVDRYFDQWYTGLKNDLSEAVGPLPGDRPHYFKAYGSYSFPFGITAGIVANAMSGSPTSSEWAMDYPGYMPFGRADKDRAPFLWFANFYVEYNFKLGRNVLNINLNVNNVFDVKTAQRIYPIYNQGAVAISDERIAQGTWDINDYEPVLDPRYLMESDFYGPLTARLGFKFSF